MENNEENKVEKNIEKNKELIEESAASANFEHTARLRTVDMEESKKKVFNVSLKHSIKTSPRYRKKYALLIVIVLAVFIGAYQFVKVKEMDFKLLQKNVSSKIDGVDLKKGDDLTLRKLYAINETEYSDFVSFAPKSNMVADEILIIKCKPGQADQVMAKIQKRVESQTKSFKDYAPQQYNIITTSELKKKGDYVIFVSAKNIAAINDEIKASYK